MTQAERIDVEAARAAFLGMGSQEWYRFLANPANLAGLTKAEREGFERAAAERVEKTRRIVEANR